MMTSEMIAIAMERGSHRFEWDHKRADGEVFPVEVLLTAIPVGDKKILYVVWRDITDRKRVEKQLAENATNAERIRLARDLLAFPEGGRSWSMPVGI